MKDALVVLGMHRSGTSSVAGALALLGAAPPRTLMAPAEDNPKGFWESSVIMALNDAMLAAHGSSWDDWRALPQPLFGLEQAREWRDRAVQALAAEFGEAPTIVLKDPRICRLFGFWREALGAAGYRPLIISPIRRPGQTAASLVSRNGLTRERALRLWLRHVLEAETSSRGLARHFMDWSDFMQDWRGQAALMSERLGVALTARDEAAAKAINAFLSPELQRHRLIDDPLPPLVARTHQTLLAIARYGEHPDLHARLDGLRHAFDQVSSLAPDAP